MQGASEEQDASCQGGQCSWARAHDGKDVSLPHGEERVGHLGWRAKLMQKQEAFMCFLVWGVADNCG